MSDLERATRPPQLSEPEPGTVEQPPPVQHPPALDRVLGSYARFVRAGGFIDREAMEDAGVDVS